MQRRAGDDSQRFPLGTPAVADAPLVGRVVAAALVAIAIACALAPLPAVARAASCAALLALAAIAARKLGVRPRAASAFVVVDQVGVSRVDGGKAQPLVLWSEPFGLSVLAHPSKTRAVLAFTTPARTRYVGVRVDDADDRAAVDALFAAAASVPETEVDEVLGRHDATLTATSASAIVRALSSRASAALERIYLTDARGQPIVLDGGKLRLGARMIDLASPLEWRGFTFHESSGHLAAFFQATWIRQDGAEAVLVAPLPMDAARPTDTRTRRILQWTPEAPPPHELRLAIDRLFMLPIRTALDKAPRISRAPSSGPRSKREGRPPLGRA
jgi:hypothetical protein